MAAYRRVYDSRHLQADCQEPGSAPEPYAQKSSTGQAWIQGGARGPCFPSAPVTLVIRLQTSTCSQQWDSQISVSGHVPMYGPVNKILDPGLRATFTFFTHRSKDRRFADATPATCHRNYPSLHPCCQNEERRWGGWRGKAESGLSNGRRWCEAQGGEKEKGKEETASQ